MLRRWTGFAALSLCTVLACGGANTGGDLGVYIRPGDVIGEPGDVPAAGDTARDAPASELADPGTDGVTPEDPGVHTDPGVQTDPGTTDTGGKDPGASDPGVGDPGTKDPGTSDPGVSDPGPQDPGPQFDPGQDDVLAGGCDPCGMGTIAGKTCAPNVKTAIPFVKVWMDTIDCNGNPVHIQTYSDATGSYSMQVPCGTQTINILKGSFHGSFTRWIDKGMTTTMTTADGCFSGTAAKIAVITGDWDQIENTLKLLYLHYTLISGTGGESGQESQTAIDFLSDSSKLNAYDVVFMDCTWAGWPDMQSSSAAQIRANLKAFVAKGGSVYASDYALPYLSETWPGYILGGGWSASGNSTYKSNVIDTDLASYLGKSQVTLKYGLGPLTCVSGVGANTHVAIESSTAIEGCDGTQMMMSFEPETNGGRVIYTTFHNDEQPTTGGDMQSIIEYTVFLM